MKKKELFEKFLELEERYEERWEETLKTLDDFILKDCITKCDKCNCLICEEDAIKGTEEIREKEYWEDICDIIPSKKKYIYTPHYCNKCAPKPKKKEKK